MSDHTEWRRLAEAAEFGTWFTTEEGVADGFDPKLAAFIAHSGPDRVLALLGEVERLRRGLEWVRDIAASVPHGQPQQGGQHAGYSQWNMTVGTKREIIRSADAALKGPDHE